MRNVALALPKISSPRRSITRHRTAIIWACATSRGFTMENVALNHEKCRYCPFSSGNQERKRIILKKEQDEEARSSSHFSYSSEGLEGKTDSPLSIFKVLNSSSPPPCRRDVVRRGRQSLRNHILDKGYLAQAMELLQARQSSLQLHILVKRQISDPILFLRLSHKPPSNTCLLPNLLGNMTIQQETQNQNLPLFSCFQGIANCRFSSGDRDLEFPSFSRCRTLIGRKCIT